MAETGRQCVRCQKHFAPSSAAWTCDSCGGNLDVLYDYDEIRSKFRPRDVLGEGASLWRFAPLLPFHDNPPPLAVGGTPLHALSTLGRRYGCPNLFAKDDSRNPTGSLKDRASAMAVVHAAFVKRSVLACASTGNAASALAGMCASAGRQSVIFVPEATPSGKLAQILAFGAYLIRVKGTYDDAFDLAEQASAKFSWYNRNTGTNPYLAEGKKTVAFEIAEQLGWRAPDWVVVPVGDGNIIGSVFKGFDELTRIGWTEHMPRLVAVQADGSSAIADALAGDGVVRPASGRTVADGIAVGMPRDPDKALRAIRSSNGLALKLPDEALLDAQRLLARSTGLFVEPAAAASFAGFIRLVEEGRLREQDTVVLLLTGSGLKAPQSILDRVPLPPAEPPQLEAVSERLRREPLHV